MAATFVPRQPEFTSCPALQTKAFFASAGDKNTPFPLKSAGLFPKCPVISERRDADSAFDEAPTA